MSPRLLWGGLTATLLASAWAVLDTRAADEEALLMEPGSAVNSKARAAAQAALAAPAASAAPAAPAALAASAASSTVWSLPEREARVAQRRDLFAAPRSPAPPVATPAAAPAPPRPVLPFTFAGRLATPGGAAVLLNEGERTHVLATGAELGAFRLDADAGNRLEFTHVASGERLVLNAQP